jgi:hypothetical protein
LAFQIQLLKFLVLRKQIDFILPGLNFKIPLKEVSLSDKVWLFNVSAMRLKKLLILIRIAVITHFRIGGS